MEREHLYRGKRVDNGEWIEGYLISNNVIVGGIIELNEEYFNTEFWCVVDPETVGQLRYTNKHGRYFDGDVYHHAGYGDELVSDICELQMALINGCSDDIGKIKGNIHDNPELY